ncbi:hypothetical protein AA102526_0226 [Asaia lannensis NBRC 102526]|nr:hypothetical protein AA102526_0226 [Asaia lannensis NBRC 102526]
MIATMKMRGEGELNAHPDTLLQCYCADRAGSGTFPFPADLTDRGSGRAKDAPCLNHTALSRSGIDRATGRVIGRAGRFTVIA